MKKLELEIEHRYKNRFVGRHRLKGDQNLTVMGASRESDIRLLGEDVNGIHAVIELEESGQWVLTDLASEHGTWVKKKPILSKVINNTTSVRIGGHHIKLTPKVLDHQIFTKEANQPSQSDDVKFHQIVIRKLNLVVNSALVGHKESFEFVFGGVSHNIKPTESTEWQNIEFGEEVVVQHRLVHSHQVKESISERFKEGMDSGMRGPAIVVSALLALFMALIFFAPQEQAPEMKELKPQENKYTRMIYDAKAVRKKRAQANRSRKKIAGRMQAPSKVPKPAPAKTATTLKGKGSKTAKVMTKLKAVGLSRLLGKISSRRSKVAHFVQTNGRKANKKGVGRAVASVGSIGGKKGKVRGPGGKFKIKGVSTAGKAGGSTAYKGIGGLAMGNTGNASVGILEEETDVQGGLERDVISRVIQSQIGQIRYCYERQLSANPDLYGKVLVKFTIGAAGAVVTQNVGLTTLKSAMVEGCILRRVAGWKFPQPKGGTSVLVTYPFLFKSTN